MSSSPASTSTNFNNITIQEKLNSLSFSHLWKSMAILGLILFLFYVFLFSSPPNYQPSNLISTFKQKWPPTNSEKTINDNPRTNLSHIVFGIVGSMNTWKDKRYYSISWWRPNVTRGYVFLDTYPNKEFLPWSSSFPPFRVNEDISNFTVYPRIIWKSQVRIFRTILETFREGDKGVRWYVMADDDTVVFLDNLVEVLQKYDHNRYLYIGMNSENVKSNYDFAFGMAFGGAGYALSYPLVQVLSKRLDGCIERNPYLRVSDHMLYTCLTDLGIQITHEKGFHQMDFRRDVWGYLSSHPQTPILTLHHIDIINPIFPGKNRSDSINHLMKAAKSDHSRLVQQTICYHRPTNWSFSVSWGYTAQIYENILPRTFLRKPLESFSPFDPRLKPPIYMFNTRLPTNDSCEAPHVFFMESVERDVQGGDQILTTYVRKWPRNLPACSQTGNHSADPISIIRVFSPATTPLQAGGIDCCEVSKVGKSDTEIKYRACKTGEEMA